MHVPVFISGWSLVVRSDCKLQKNVVTNSFDWVYSEVRTNGLFMYITLLYFTRYSDRKKLGYNERTPTRHVFGTLRSLSVKTRVFDMSVY